MVRRHRKLFPISTNQTTDCHKLCDPACSFNCYSYPYYYYYYTSPPPPENPPPLFSAVEDPSHQNNHVSLYLIILASLFAGLFLLAAYFVINKTYSFLCCNNRGHSPSVQDNTNEEFLDENQVDHPIWYIATVGLQQTIINSITICRYKKGEGLVEGTECSVCLGEFQEDETLRLLPKCSHAFHVSCIDTWLRSHTNCPLCRATIVSNSGNTEVYIPALPSANQESDHSSGNEETQIEDSGNHGNNTVVIITEISENRAGMGNEEEPEVTHGEMSFKEHVHDNTNNSVTHQTDNGEIEVTTISTDSSSGAAKSCFAEPERNIDTHSGAEQILQAVFVSEQDGECSSLFTKMSHSTIEKYLHMRPVSMKRSFSCGGRITYHER